MEDQLRRTRTALKLNADAGLHSVRHTFLTEIGRKTDPFTLQRIAGHARITTTQRYLHTQQESIEADFAARESRAKSPTVENRPEEQRVYN